VWLLPETTAIARELARTQKAIMSRVAFLRRQELITQRAAEGEDCSALMPGSLSQLTAREKQLLRRLALGRSDVQIAREIGGTYELIASQRERLLTRLRISSEKQIVEAADKLAGWKMYGRSTGRRAAPRANSSPGAPLCCDQAEAKK